MQTFIVILRGVNVSGKNILPMAELRYLLYDLKFENVQTYIQSGNIVLNSELSKDEVIESVKNGIVSIFGFNVAVLAKTISEWENAIANNPYPTNNHKIVSFTFLSEVPKETTVEVTITNDDVYSVINDMVYMYCPDGFGRTKLTNNLFEKKLKVVATSRNFRTTMKLLEMAKNNMN